MDGLDQASCSAVSMSSIEVNGVLGSDFPGRISVLILAVSRECDATLGSQSRVMLTMVLQATAGGGRGTTLLAS